MNRIELNAQILSSREALFEALNERFSFDHVVKNMDDLFDTLSEVDEETMLIVEEKDLHTIEQDVIKVLHVLVHAVKDNPYLHMHLVEEQ